jgi:nucleoside phosphorylase
MKYPIVILTALEVEREAVEFHLKNKTVETHPNTGTDYVKGTFSKDGIDLEIIVGRTDQTNVNAAMETERALEYFDPKYVFYVGVAGGLKDVCVGDIVIGTDVIGYERGKAEELSFKPRPQFGASSYDLERLATTYSNSSDWKNTLKELNEKKFSPEIKIFTGTIASGEKVDASYQSDLHKHIKQNASHALAIEMEGLGFLRVCQTRPSIKSLLLRGISDLVNDKGEMDSIGSQPYASKNVSAFLFGVITQLDFKDQTLSIQSPEDKLFEILCKLYPRGIEDKGVWLRAGGDLSLLPFGISGKGQWVEAIRLLKLGGGGKITKESLKNCILEDFHNNHDVQKL